MFFLVYGKKAVYRDLGYVADYCPICRGPSAFKLQRVGLARHVYYLSVGDGALAGHQRTCCACGTALKADPPNYAQVSAEKLSVDELLPVTHPKYEIEHKKRADLDQRAVAGSLSSDERRALLREPFVVLSPKVEKRFAKTHIDGHVGLAILAALVLLVLVPRASRSLDRKVNPLIPIGLGIALVIWQSLGSSRRFFKREIYPPLSRALTPLRPSGEELENVLRELREGGLKIGKRTKAQALLAEITHLPSSHLVRGDRPPSPRA